MTYNPLTVATQVTVSWSPHSTTGDIVIKDRLLFKFQKITGKSAESRCIFGKSEKKSQ